MLNQSDIKATISEFSKHQGFSKIGFANAEVLKEEFENYQHWIESGYQAEMHYLERNIDKRKNISLILENAKTIIVTATNYYTGKKDNNATTGKISGYAWGEDYHDILIPRLKEISSFIKEKYDAESKCYVDTGPILEKIWAERAGIGWQGKNSLILTKEFGSYIFLGIIITTLEIEPDIPINELCGKCTKCLTACPTNAIISPKVVDSNKCLSYWTIEAKPEQLFPDSIGKNLVGNLFGCDICQEVCPWNSKAVITNEPAFYPRNNETFFNLDVVKEMTAEQFSARFKGTPVKRLKLAGLKRNADFLNKEYE